jgi:hypothetical protein
LARSRDWRWLDCSASDRREPSLRMASDDRLCELTRFQSLLARDVERELESRWRERSHLLQFSFVPVVVVVP